MIHFCSYQWDDISKKNSRHFVKDFPFYVCGSEQAIKVCLRMLTLIIVESYLTSGIPPTISHILHSIVNNTITEISQIL